MKESYITKNFKKTAAARFPVHAEQLNAAFYARLQALRRITQGPRRKSAPSGKSDPAGNRGI